MCYMNKARHQTVFCMSELNGGFVFHMENAWRRGWSINCMQVLMEQCSMSMCLSWVHCTHCVGYIDCWTGI